MQLSLFCYFCHSVSNSRKELPDFYFHLDRNGIILHIWATSLSVLLLDYRNRRTPWFTILGITLTGFVSVDYLDLRMRKTERISIIGEFGAFALSSVLLNNTVNIEISRLTASYVTGMVVINSIGGWSYSRGSNRSNLCIYS